VSPCQGESEHASDGPDQESYRPETQALHEDLSRMRGKKRCKRSEVQKLPKQKPALEEKRACEIVSSVKRVLLALKKFNQSFKIENSVCAAIFY
jgi:hypothetical protein